MAERPAIDSGIGFIKIISVIAPLAGLLGTVTGMIVTFQMITFMEQAIQNLWQVVYLKHL